MHPTFLSQASVSTVNLSFGFGKASAGGYKFFLQDFKGFLLQYVKVSKNCWLIVAQISVEGCHDPCEVKNQTPDDIVEYYELLHLRNLRWFLKAFDSFCRFSATCNFPGLTTCP